MYKLRHNGVTTEYTADELIDFCNDQYAETDNIDDAIENDLMYFDNAYDAFEMLKEFDWDVEEI